MKFRSLLRHSKAQLEAAGSFTPVSFSPAVFSAGAQWMYGQLPAQQKGFNKAVSYTFYGLFKYGISLFAFGLAGAGLFKINPILLPLAVFAFYLVEVHFLFLFPLLLDGVAHPVWESIRQTYRIGLLTALRTLIPIGFYMLAGLVRFKSPLRNWHTGCGAILIWYQHEVRNRV